MKISKIIPIVLSVISFHAFADNIGEDGSEEIVIIPELNNNDSDNPIDPIARPKAPSHQRIVCHYSNGMLFIQFAISEGNCELTVVNNENGDSQIYDFDSSVGSFIYIGEMTSFELFIETETGKSYYGYK